MKPDEQAFLDRYDPSGFERPSLAVDVVVLTASGGKLHALLAKRDQHPFRDHWALPGGFVGMEESLPDAARRILESKGGLRDVFIEQLYTFGAPERDPRMRIVSVAYYALVSAGKMGEGHWFELDVPWSGEEGGAVGIGTELAFDHADILGVAVQRIRGKLDYTPIGFQLLPPRFTLRMLQDVHETVLAKKVNKDSFRRRMLASGQLEATGEREKAVGHRPAELYRFVRTSAI